MFELSGPWWELPLRVTLVYVVLLILVRLSGKRTVGQFTPFDLLVVLLLSEVVSGGLSGDDRSVTGAALGAGTLVALNFALAALTARSARLHAVAEGNPVLIARDGHIFHKVLKKNQLAIGDVERALREADCDLTDVKYAFLEVNGGISVLTQSSGTFGAEGSYESVRPVQADVERVASAG